MGKPLPNIQENINELEHMLKTEKNKHKRDRIHALYLIKSEQAKTRIQIAKILSVNRITIGIWLNIYEKQGLSKLLTINTRPNRKLSIPPDILIQLEQRLKQPEGFKSYKEIQLWLCNEFSLNIHYRTVNGIVRNRLKAKLKVGRKSHIKKTNKKA
jgi:transposase